ncbi:hypothetical protein [Laceyella putida]|uniref:Uncharacterized protein n=1 Tax=Laceyella putida TaxID=110101 RepID=A0ABW2RLK9_9BACL
MEIPWRQMNTGTPQAFAWKRRTTIVLPVFPLATVILHNKPSSDELGLLTD